VFEKQPGNVNTCLEIVKTADGLHSLYNGSDEADPTLFVFVQQWDSYDAHQDFKKVPVYGKLMDIFNTSILDKSRKNRSRHVVVETDLPNMSDDHLMVITSWLVKSDKRTEAEEYAKSIAKKTVGTYGWEYENKNNLWMVTSCPDQKSREEFISSLSKGDFAESMTVQKKAHMKKWK